MSYESSLASGWEGYSNDAYEYEVDVEYPCDECGAEPAKGMTAEAILDARDGSVEWTCLECGERNWFKLNYGYDDIAEDKYYDL
jgi:DNA-directed RNA polymerase subunit RPC12/RpoP